MKTRQIINVLLSIASTIFSLSFLWAYFNLKPIPGFGKEMGCVMFAWFLCMLCMVVVSLLGAIVNFFKVIANQKISLLTIPDSFNPFYRLKDENLEDEGKVARRNLIIFLSTFFISWIGGVLVAVIHWVAMRP